MKSRDFCYWLQGFFEINGKTQSLTTEQVETIQRHLNMVFIHEIDPTFGPPEAQYILNQTHNKPTTPQGIDIADLERPRC